MFYHKLLIKFFLFVNYRLIDWHVFRIFRIDWSYVEAKQDLRVDLAQIVPACCVSGASPHFCINRFNYFKYFKHMLQVFYKDIAKIDRDVAHVAIVVHVCCKHLFQMLHLLFQTYVASGLFGCCICFTHMLQEYVQNVLAVSTLCYNKCLMLQASSVFI